MRLASRRWPISRSTTSRREWLRSMGPICAAPTVRKRVIVTFRGDYCRGWRVLQALRAGAFYIVGELGRAESAALEEIADRIGPDLCLLGLGMGAVVLGLPGGAIAELAGARIVPPPRRVVRCAVKDLETAVGMLQPDADQLHDCFLPAPVRPPP